MQEPPELEPHPCPQPPGAVQHPVVRDGHKILQGSLGSLSVMREHKGYVENTRTWSLQVVAVGPIMRHGKWRVGAPKWVPAAVQLRPLGLQTWLSLGTKDARSPHGPRKTTRTLSGLRK
eukprot:jgi/Botrbrau1/19846/Bobra.0124s0082.1